MQLQLFFYLKDRRISCRDEGMFFGGLRLMLVIELVSKWEICWALWSLVVFDPVDDLK